MEEGKHLLNNDRMNELIQLNDRLVHETQSSLQMIIESLQKSNFKYTSKALLGFIPKSGYLNSAILECYGSRNVYAAAVLYRSIIEHSFRQLYIYAKSLEDNSDDIGRKYCVTLKSGEDLQWFDKINNYNSKLGANKTIWNTKSDNKKEIRAVATEFKFSEIVDYFKNNNNNWDESIKVHLNNHLLERSVEYGDLSSAVHGGPFGELALYNYHMDKEKMEDTLYKFAYESFGLHYSIVESTYLFAYLMNDEMKDQYEKIKELRKK